MPQKENENDKDFFDIRVLSQRWSGRVATQKNLLVFDSEMQLSFMLACAQQLSMISVHLVELRDVLKDFSERQVK